MRFEVSERIDTGRGLPDVLALAAEQFKKISRSIEAAEQGKIKAKGIEATFGSINRSDSAMISAKPLDGGYLLTADVTYSPSFFFWIFLLLGLFTYIGWLIPIAFYLLQKNSVRAATEGALKRVANELRETPQTNLSQIAQASSFDDLERIAQFRDRGILTEQEFQDKKQAILNRG